MDSPEIEEWREVRRFLNAHRYDLSSAAMGLYPDADQVGSTPLLCRPEWIPSHPVLLERVRLAPEAQPLPPAVTGSEPESARVRPARPDAQPYPSYAAALAALAPPRLFEDRACYRLTAASFTDTDVMMRCAVGTYFEGINLGEAVAHEFAQASMAGSTAELPLRTRVGDPTDLARRTVLPAVSMLTLRREPMSGAMSFVLHWRDPNRVAHAGGLFQVMPVGIFQPADDGAAAWRRDLNLWRCMVREYSEEFLGGEETYGSLDYDDWPFYGALTRARDDRLVRSYVLGLGVDPLTLATDILAVTVIDDIVYDQMFGQTVSANAEGQVIGAETRGFVFNAETIERFASSARMQAAGIAVLSLAWKHRDVLADGT